MAQFWYYSLKDQWWDLLDSILTQHTLRLVIDQPYNIPQCTYYAAITEELRNGSVPVSRVHLLGSSFAKEPLLLRMQEGGALTGKYFIDDSRGGPSLDLVRSGEIIENGMIWFSPGWLSFHKLYWNDSLTQAYPAPKELRDAFCSVRQSLQRQLIDRVVAGQKLWATREAWDLYDAARAAFPIAGRCYRVDGEVPLPPAWRYAHGDE